MVEFSEGKEEQRIKKTWEEGKKVKEKSKEGAEKRAWEVISQTKFHSGGIYRETIFSIISEIG